jgi:gamma-glutamyltranspeptidase/glutathione hydrolase
MTEPSATGIGGDVFCLFYNGKTKKVHALNASGRSNSTTTLDEVRKKIDLPDGKDGGIPPLSIHSVTVPGAAAGWADAVQKFGSGKVTLEQILAPAIALGENGFPVSEVSAYFWHRSEAIIKNASANGHEILKPDPKAPGEWRAPRYGEIMKNPTLANTFRLLGKHGKKGFYEGFVAEAYVKVCEEHGGAISHDDLKHHAELGSEEVDAISLKFNAQGVNPDFGGLRVWEHPPNGQGIVALMALGIIQELEKSGKIKRWTKDDHNSAE